MLGWLASVFERGGRFSFGCLAHRPRRPRSVTDRHRGSRMPVALCRPAILVNQATEHLLSLDRRFGLTAGPPMFGCREGFKYAPPRVPLRASALPAGARSLEER